MNASVIFEAMKENKKGRPDEGRERVTIRVLPSCAKDLRALALTHGSIGKGVEFLNGLNTAPSTERALSKHRKILQDFGFMRAVGKKNKRAK